MNAPYDGTGEQDPTEAMVEQQKQAHARAADDENYRVDDHDGSEQTARFDVSEALSNL